MLLSTGGGVARRPCLRIGFVGFLAALLHPAPVRSQFGGGGNYNPPAPICPAFKCSGDQKAVGRVDHQIWSYGCKDSGMNVFNMASLDPKHPYGGLQQKNVDKCCVERDICKQTCGMTSKMCHDNFQKCSQKVCKGDQNCQLQAMMSDIMSEPYDDLDKQNAKDTKYDPELTKCRGYVRGQQDACTCVPKDDFRGALESKLKVFYTKFNPEKLDESGEIKDVTEVWKKWKGKEPDMFLALATKYKAQAVDVREKPKPPPYEPPPSPTKKPSPSTIAADDDNSVDHEEVHRIDAEEEAFERKRVALEAKKRKAKESEDYDAAEAIKAELVTLKKAEIQRLSTHKVQALEEENYLEAKRIKVRLQLLDEL